MSHHKHSTVVFVVGVGRLVRELLGCGNGFTLLLLALFFVMPSFLQYPYSVVFCRLGTKWKLPLLLAAEIGSCFRNSDLVRLVLGRIGLSLVRVLFPVQVHVENVAFRRVAPCTHMFFINQQNGLKIRVKEGVSPLLERQFASRRTVVRGYQGIFAPSHDHPH